MSYSFCGFIKMHLENFSFVHICIEQELFLVVKIQAACWGGIGENFMDIVPVPSGVLHVDGIGVGEHDVHLGPGQLGLAHVVLQFVSFNTTASIISIFVVIVSVVTLLITETPLFALITIWKVEIFLDYFAPNWSQTHRCKICYHCRPSCQLDKYRFLLPVNFCKSIDIQDWSTGFWLKWQQI